MIGDRILEINCCRLLFYCLSAASGGHDIRKPTGSRSRWRHLLSDLVALPSELDINIRARVHQSSALRSNRNKSVLQS